MHFHDQLGCLKCKKTRPLSTPIPNDLILDDACEWCGEAHQIGLIERRVCRDCLEEYLNRIFARSGKTY